jgi:hypothetical protein
LIDQLFVHALRGKEFIEYDNPFDLGMTGLLGFSSGYFAMMNCDVPVMLGTDFPYQPFFPKDAIVVQIDLRGEQIGRRSKVDLGFVCDTKSTWALLPKLKSHWRLLGPLESLTGALMCGVSVSILFALVTRLVDSQDPQKTDGDRRLNGLIEPVNSWVTQLLAGPRALDDGWVLFWRGTGTEVSGSVITKNSCR